MTSQGEDRIIAFHNSLLKDDKGEIIGVLFSGEDITNRKRAEAEVKTLRGIIPICMPCKGITDDKGYWNALEKYISENSDIQFSHGICEKCLDKFYPKKNN